MTSTYPDPHPEWRKVVLAKQAPFELDDAANPHPAMLALALKLRARIRVTHSPADDHTWNGCRLTMMAATGWTDERLTAYLDSHDLPG